MLLLMKKIKPRFKETINEEKNYCNDKIEYCPTRIKEGLNWLYFFDKMEFTADRMDNRENALTLIVKDVSMFQISCW